MNAWSDETVPPTLVALGQGIRAGFSLQATAIGTKGDQSHTYGGHRSRRWIMEEGDGLDDYTVQLPADQGGNANWISALDASLDRARMIAVTGRLITALKHRDPRVGAVREVFGTLDGYTVAGWDAAFMRTTTADDSHTWHIHITFYRSRAGDDHSGLLDVILGRNTPEDDMDPKLAFNLERYLYASFMGVDAEDIYTPSGGRTTIVNAPARAVKDLDERLAALEAQPAGSVDTQAVIDGVVAALEPKISAAVAAELARRLAE